MIHIAIIRSEYYSDITEYMAKDAEHYLKEKKVSTERINVPGTFEIPGAIATLAKGKKQFDGYVTIGCVIRGETNHYDYVCSETSRGIMELSFKEGLAMGFGILTVENREQAWVRAMEKHKGIDSAHACYTMVALKKAFMD